MPGTAHLEDTRGPADTLRALGVTRSFAGVVALFEVDLDLHRHEVLGLIGPNGAGKSTLVNIMTGFDTPSQGGRIEMEEVDITGWRPHRLGRFGLARTFQQGHAFPALTVRENIEVSALGIGARPGEARRRADVLMDLLDLTAHGEAAAAILPHGAERKLGVARALATEPRFVLLDEPAAGLNETEVPDFADVIRSVRDDHEVGVLLIDHNVSLIMSVCDRIQGLDQGRTIAMGSPQEIARDPAVATAYLGSTGV